MVPDWVWSPAEIQSPEKMENYYSRKTKLFLNTFLIRFSANPSTFNRDIYALFWRIPSNLSTVGSLFSLIRWFYREAEIRI